MFGVSLVVGVEFLRILWLIASYEFLFILEVLVILYIGIKSFSFK